MEAYQDIKFYFINNIAIKCNESEFNTKKHNEKVKGTDDMGKIVWIPKKLLKKL